MVHIRPFQPADEAALRALSVSQAQRPFVGTTDQLLDEQEADWHYQLIVAADEIVGMFNIDAQYAQRYSFAHPNELGLRAMLIDQHQQGNGYAKAALLQLAGYLSAHFATAESVCLTVNARNHPAYKLYCQVGFSDTGQHYLGGSAGPQHILRMPLRTT